jgi:hypothetical protein
MTFAEFFARYWWLMFPLFGMGMGVIGMITSFQHRQKKLDLLKSYADQGKEPPQFLLDALNDGDDDDYEHRRMRRGRRPWWGMAVFGPLALAFWFMATQADVNEPDVFMAMAVGFGAAASLTFIYSLVSLIGTRGRSDSDRDGGI